jgi:hypothetical protein
MNRQESDRQKDKQIWQTERQRYRLTDKQTDRDIDKQKDQQKVVGRESQADHVPKQIERHADKDIY